MIKLLQPIVNRRYAVLFTWHPLGIDSVQQEWLLASGAAGSRLPP